ncbi:CdaR family transcriptional regulator [Paenibacillus macerans]|uniref:PucR family transcriptional regulator n=1 Tax=Paenibacillus macerans TaxID=44252 RepID=UPI00203C87FD|nr:helix-turn-helix domain-containing protein [Paenibacillus macerans]MCM3703831.1 helix-turn-helix domain-containing protein [Paenibacillus macerans]
MEIKKLKQQVESIIGTSITESTWDVQVWRESVEVEAGGTVGSGPVRKDGRVVWHWNTKADAVQVLQADAGEVTDAEAMLIQMLLSAARDQRSQTAPLKQDDESRSIQFGEWLLERMSRHEINLSVPDPFPIKSRLKGCMLPFLLSWDHAGQGQTVSFAKLHKLLRSYFGGDIVLVPLKEEWLILLGEELLTSLREESEEGAETERDMLGALCQGLYELITNEWVGGIHIAAGNALVGERELTSAALALRHTMTLGRIFNVTNKIHLPWELKLEQLVYSIPEDERLHFIEGNGDHAKVFEDEETLTTLETFFDLDCNVSETAKRLYIHRNTLLYRIDKFKQETGLDVRTFRDAVLVKLELLLYKVTKTR